MNPILVVYRILLYFPICQRDYKHRVEKGTSQTVVLKKYVHRIESYYDNIYDNILLDFVFNSLKIFVGFVRTSIIIFRDGILNSNDNEYPFFYF